MPVIGVSGAMGIEGPPAGAPGVSGPLRTADGGYQAGSRRMILLLDSSGSMSEPAGGGQTTRPTSARRTSRWPATTT
ncbi:hypothetical protein [Nocardioides sp. T2.26MG-1]|uniref:hypothetical protein n=1 Tax=Nocardioides sp. T2.26MG-1 TaxID=3041166 RepID=UPI0025422BCF|nr:hypothetical protein [Nocardioides sp. T2.26MG-1]